MFEEERQIRIMNELSEQRTMLVGDLAAILGVSPSTVRRDLSSMEEKGLVKRTHGGAMIVEETDASLSYAVRSAHNVKLKAAIARCAAAQVEEGDVGAARGREA